MARTLGVLTTERISVGMVEGNQIIGEVLHYPERDDDDVLRSLNADALVAEVANQIQMAAPKEEVGAIGLGVPGVIRGGVIEESPNLQQLKGYNVQQSLQLVLGQRGISATVSVCNDADVMAAGIAATAASSIASFGSGHSETESDSGAIHRRKACGKAATAWSRSIRRKRSADAAAPGTWRVSWGIAPCGCAFWTSNPTKSSSRPRLATRNAPTSRLWHRALAAATASSIHMEGPGKFYITGPNAVCGHRPSQPLHAANGEDEPAAGLRVRDRARRRRHRHHRRSRERRPRGPDIVKARKNQLSWKRPSSR